MNKYGDGRHNHPAAPQHHHHDRVEVGADQVLLAAIGSGHPARVAQLLQHRGHVGLGRRAFIAVVQLVLNLRPQLGLNLLSLFVGQIAPDLMNVALD